MGEHSDYLRDRARRLRDLADRATYPDDRAYLLRLAAASEHEATLIEQAEGPSDGA